MSAWRMQSAATGKSPEEVEKEHEEPVGQRGYAADQQRRKNTQSNRGQTEDELLIGLLRVFHRRRIFGC
jgi:hypothetical protein